MAVRRQLFGKGFVQIVVFIVVVVVLPVVLVIQCADWRTPRDEGATSRAPGSPPATTPAR